MRTSEFVDGVIARLEKTPVDLALLAPESVPGSIFSGAVGVAFFLHEVARLRGRDDLLPLARRWLTPGRAWAKTAPPGEWNDMHRGLVSGTAAGAYVDALISVREGDAARALAAAEEIEQGVAAAAEDPAAKTELLGGAAGIMCGARDLEGRLPASPDYGSARAALTRARERSRDKVLARWTQPLVLQPGQAIGVAHGVAGDLWGLVTEVGPNHEVVRARLAELAATRELDEEGLVYWLPSLGSDATNLLGSWCNGMAGHALLWAEVVRRGGGGDEAKALAHACAESATILMNGTASLCCGLAGTSVALQRYADVSGDKRMARRAYDRMRQAIETIERQEQEGEGQMFLSTWQGAIGVALLAMRKIEGERSLPCIEAGAA